VCVWVGVTFLVRGRSKSFTFIVECPVHLVSIVTTSSDDFSGMATLRKELCSIIPFCGVSVWSHRELQI
jgi:hypothetical protein